MPNVTSARWAEPAPISWIFDRVERIPLRVSLAGLFLVSLGLRLYYLNDGLFMYDSVRLAQAVEDTWRTGDLHGQVNGRHGSVLFGLLAYLPDRLLTGELSAERALLTANAFWSAAAVPAVFFLGNSLLRNARAAWLGAALFSISPIYLSVSTWAKPHGLEVFQIVASLALLAASRSHAPHRRFLLASLIMGSAILCREAALLLLPLYVLMYLRPQIGLRPPILRIDPRVVSLRWLAAAVLPLALLLGLAWWFYLGDVVLRTLTVDSSNTVSFRVGPTPMLVRALSDLVAQLTPLGVLLSGFGALYLARHRDRFGFVLIVAWAALFYPVGNASAYWPRLLAVLSPPFLLCMGLGGAWLYGRSRLAALVVVVIIAAQMLNTIVPILEYRRSLSGGKAQALWLRQRLPSNSVVIAMDDSIFIQYYAGLETLSHPINDWPATQEWIASLKKRLRSGTPVYMIKDALNYDASGRFLKALNANFFMEELGTRLVEDYHQSALTDRRYQTRLFSVEIRSYQPPMAPAG